MTENRQSIRTQIQEKRNQLTPDQVNQFSKQIAAHLDESEIFQNSQHIACYISCNHEVNTQWILEKIWRANKSCYLPILRKDKHLDFMHHLPRDILKKNQFNIPEPMYDETRVIPIDKLDLMLIPLVAFDSRGNRLGMGVGYYDRTFAHKVQKPLLVGLAYAFQQVPDIQPELWDVPLNGVLTEEKLIWF